MTESAMVVTGDRAYDANYSEPLTQTVGGRLRVDAVDASRATGLGDTGATVPRVVLAGNRSATYAVTGTGYTAYATPTDMLVIKGSASKTIAILAMTLRVNTTTAGLQTVFWIKRSAADTGGTLTNPTPIPYDSANAAATAVVELYTAAPTLGAAVGTIAYHSAATAVLTGAPGLFLMTNNALQGNAITLTQPITLRGVAEELAINWNGAALPGGFTAQYDIEWIEF